MNREPIAVLGATGLVGQRLLQRLERHPWFRAGTLIASERSAGRPYGAACRWRLDTPLPPDSAMRVVQPIGCAVPERLVVSALDAEAARQVEPALAAAGHLVVTNASALRMDPAVPLLIPEVNGDHLALLAVQRCRWPGGVVANPNCSATALALVLAPLHRAFGVRRVQVVTMQALSGAGYPGVPALDAMGNVLPGIPGEAAKIAAELPKLLGTLEEGGVRLAPLGVEALTTRVPVVDGHLAGLFVELDRDAPRQAVAAALETWAPLAGRALPSAPAHPVVVLDAEDRPQPRLDALTGGGMAVAVGALARTGPGRYSMMVLGHNTIRGAAGGALLNAELLWTERVPIEPTSAGSSS